MKILHFIPSFGSGGAERQLTLITSGLAHEGIETHVAYYRGGPNMAMLRHSKVRLHALPSKGSYDPILAWSIVQLVRRLRPDIVQTWLPQMDILGGAAALLNRVPLVVSERSSAAAYPSSLKTRLRLLLGRRAACIAANSHGGIYYWRPHMPGNRLHLVHNCVVPADDRTGLPDYAFAAHLVGRSVVLFAGRFSYEKNIPVLVDSLILVAQQYPAAIIMMFGEGPERESAVRRFADVGLAERIVVAGYSSQLASWMAHAAVCVSVSHFEGRPNVVMEAAVAGCPLVLSDIAAHRELFDETSASLVPVDSPPRIAEAVLEVLQNPASAHERAVRARNIAMEFDLPSTVAAYRSIYEKVLAAAGSAVR